MVQPLVGYVATTEMESTMRQLVVALLFGSFTSAALAQAFADSSSLGTVDLAVCTAAVMKSGQGIALYKTWSGALDERYKVIYPKLSDKERDAYTSERIIDKRRALEAKGIVTVPAYKRFYVENCNDARP